MQQTINRVDFLFATSKQSLTKNITKGKEEGISFKSIFENQITKNSKTDDNNNIVSKTDTKVKKDFHQKAVVSINSKKVLDDTNQDNNELGTFISKDSDNLSQNLLLIEFLNGLLNTSIKTPQEDIDNVLANTNFLLDGFGQDKNGFGEINPNSIDEILKSINPNSLNQSLSELIKLENQIANGEIDLSTLKDSKYGLAFEQILKELENLMQDLNADDNISSEKLSELDKRVLQFLDSVFKPVITDVKNSYNELNSIMVNLLKKYDTSDDKKAILNNIIKSFESVIKFMKLKNNDEQLIFSSAAKDNGLYQKSIYDILSNIQDTFVSDKRLNDSDNNFKDTIQIDMKDNTADSINNLIGNKLNENVANLKESQKLDLNFKLSVINQVVSKMNILLKENLTTLTVSLKPEWLGNVLIELNKDINGNITGNIYVNNPHVKEVMESSLGNLMTILKDQGLNISQLNVSLSNNQNNQSFQNNQRFTQRETAMIEADEPQRTIENLIYEISENLLNLEA